MANKNKLHARNLHNQAYDFKALVTANPKLKSFVRPNPYGTLSIDFANSEAVKQLNAAILQSQYAIDYWDIPTGFLCPPIPGRVDYIHYLADLLKVSNGNKIPNKIRGLDIGTGASCIYPILGAQVYQWQFVASDIDIKSIESSQQIIDKNQLNNNITLRHQGNSQQIFNGIIQPTDCFDFTLSNPPFHQSLKEAHQGASRKRKNLGTNQKGQDKLNFGGQKAELWCPGGELAFVSQMIKESKTYANQVLWFSSLISKSANIAPLKKRLKAAKAVQVNVVEMAQGQKISRFIAWSFFTSQQQVDWHQSKAK